MTKHSGNPPQDVDSEEKQQGSEIELDEENLPSQAMATHELIRHEGEKELERDVWALLWSAIAAGLSMSASLLAPKPSAKKNLAEARWSWGDGRVEVDWAILRRHSLKLAYYCDRSIFNSLTFD